MLGAGVGSYPTMPIGSNPFPLANLLILNTYSMEQKQELMQLIQNGSVPQLLDSSIVGDRFMHLYKVINGIKDPARAEAFYTAEKFHFLKLINDNPKLAACTKLSLYGVFMDVAVNGLSFDPSMKHLYVVPYNINVGTKENQKWEARASLQISGYGELLLRVLQGQIKYADNPVLVYEGDEFRFGQKNGHTVVEHMACIPRKSDNIIASFIKLTRHDGSYDYKVMAMEDILKLQKFSKDPKSKAWTDGLAGMVAAKTIKHAFKNYPKLRVGEFSKLSSDIVEEELQDNPQIDYGFGTSGEEFTQHVDENDAFASDNHKQATAGVVHDDENF